MSGRELLKNGLKKSFSGTVLVTIALLINGAFSYLLQLFLGRFLTVQDYGTFNALLSMFYIFSVPAAVLGISIVKVSSDLFGEEKIEKLTKLFWGLSARMFGFGLAVVVALFIFRNLLASYLNINEPILFLFLGLYVLGAFIVLTPQSYLRGMLMFNQFSIYAVVVGVFRLVIPLGLVYAGYRVRGAYSGLFLSLAASYIFALIFFKNKFVYESETKVKSLYKKIIQFSAPVLLIQLGLMAITNMDMILVKSFFPGVTAGYYAGVVTLGKIILFGAGSVTMVMFPEISALRAAGKNYMKRFKFFVLFQLGVLIPAILAFTIFPRLITLIFFGEQFINSVKYLPMFSIFISLYVLANFMIQFFLAVEKTNVSLFLIAPVVIQFAGINFFHSNLHQVITINIISTLILLVSLGFYLYKINYDRIHNRSSI